MDKKVFRICLTSTDYNRAACAKLDLPAQPWELADAMDKVRLPEGDSLRLEITHYYDFEDLSSCFDGENLSLPELNDLAERLYDLDEKQYTAFQGLVQMEIEKDEPITLKCLRDLAESVDCCHVVESVVTDEELGQFYAENGFVPELEDISDDVFELLDFEKVGRSARIDEGGVFVPSGAVDMGGYVVQNSELKKAPEISWSIPPEPNYAVYLQLIAHHDDLPFGGTDIVELKLPAKEDEMEMAVRWLGNIDWGAVECTCLDCKVPALAEHITSAVPFETIERLGDVLAQMSAEKLPVYKALIEATECQNVECALGMAEQLDEYILSPSIASPEDAATEELSRILPEQAARFILPHINLHNYGLALLESRIHAETEYGLLERRDNQPIQCVGEYQPEDQMEEMTL